MLDISLELLIICASVVLLTLSFLNFKLYGPIMGNIKLREQTIDTYYLNEKNNNKKIEELQKEIDSILAQARDESFEIVDKARREANISLEDFRKKLKTELDSDFNSFYANLQKEKTPFIKGLSEYSDDINNALKSKLLV